MFFMELLLFQKKIVLYLKKILINKRYGFQILLKNRSISESIATMWHNKHLQETTEVLYSVADNAESRHIF